MRKCTGCGWIEGNPFGLNPKGEEYLGCCPDSNYKELTAMQELIYYMKTYFHLTDESLEMFDKSLEKEKEQIIEAYKGGVKLISGDVDDAAGHYYNQTYKPETI